MCIELAKQIPADGEGATHLIEVDVRGAQSDADARKIAHTVACSNLVKSAVFGCDPIGVASSRQPDIAEYRSTSVV